MSEVVRLRLERLFRRDDPDAMVTIGRMIEAQLLPPLHRIPKLATSMMRAELAGYKSIVKWPAFSRATW